MSISVLHVAQPTTEGVAICVERLAVAQHEAGWRVAVACPDEPTLASDLRAAGIEVVAWASEREPGLSAAGEVARLGRIVRRVDPQVVHLHSSKAGFVGRLLLCGRRPTLFHPNAWSFYAATGLKRRLALTWERSAARWTHAVLCSSAQERADGIQAGITAPMVVVGNCVDLASHPVAGPAERAAARARLGQSQAPLAVCVGRLCFQKGQDLLLEAWPVVTEAVPEARLVLVGGGPERAALGARPVRGVDFVGPRDDVPDWLAAADVVVLPSRYEGMSFTLLEAMATGRSVVCHDVSGMADALGYDGRAGALVPVGDRGALAAGIAERLSTPGLAEAEGRVARERVEAFSLEAWADRIAEATAAAATNGSRRR